MGTAEGKAREARQTAYRGDIYALEEDREELTALGVELGGFNARWRCFEDCWVGREALERLRALGNKYLWELTPVMPGEVLPMDGAPGSASSRRRETARLPAPAWLTSGAAPRGSTQ